MIKFNNPLGRQDVFQMSESQLNAEIVENEKKLHRQCLIGRPLTKAHTGISWLAIGIMVAKLFV